MTHKPPELHCNLGAGCLVYHRNHILLVQINYGPAAGHWILPGGYVDHGEHPNEAAIRETKEETGLDVRIDSQVAVRHRRFDGGRANVYWVFKASVVELKPDDDFPQVFTQETELQDVKFWSVAEAVKDTKVRPMTRLFIRMGLNPQVHYQVVKPEDHNWDDVVFGCEIKD